MHVECHAPLALSFLILRTSHAAWQPPQADVFFEPSDNQRYLELVREGCRAARVEVISYCLMPNHVHLVLVPPTETGLVDALAVSHQKYTWSINLRMGWQGYLWQRRFYSCPLDETHLLTAIRYVELNPVRARLVDTAEQ